MGIFDRFRRKEQDSAVLPAEVSEYYQSEQRERRGVALALGIITLIITLLISTGLFFGGRYVYRKATDKDKSTAVQTNPGAKKQDSNQQTNPSSNSPGSTGSTAPSTATPAPTTPAPPATTPSPVAATPSTGDQPPAGTLPSTGDEGM